MSTLRSHQKNFSGINPGNAEYIDQLYEAFKESPDRVSPEWRHYFYGFEHGAGGEAAPSLHAPLQDAHSRVDRLIMAYRLLGHTFANTDPLQIRERQRQRPSELSPEYYGLDKEALRKSVSVVSIDPVNALPAHEVIDILDRVYCATVACEHMHISASNERRWIEQRLESTHGDWAAQHPPRARHCQHHQYKGSQRHREIQPLVHSSRQEHRPFSDIDERQHQQVQYRSLKRQR